MKLCFFFLSSVTSKVFHPTVVIVIFVGKRVKDSYSKSHERDLGCYNIDFLTESLIVYILALLL